MANDPKDETYSEEETVARRERALKRMLNTPKRPRNVKKASPAAADRAPSS
jgi:hypothetical protein